MKQYNLYLLLGMLIVNCSIFFIPKEHYNLRAGAAFIGVLFVIMFFYYRKKTNT